MSKHAVQGETAAAWNPTVAVRMLEQATNELEGHTTVVRAQEGRWLGSGPNRRAGSGSSVEVELPDCHQRRVAFWQDKLSPRSARSR